MRIISNFRDYYDSVQRLDEDRDTMYIRKSKFVQIPGGTKKNGLREFSAYFIGFCGKVYPVISTRSASAPVHFYDAESTIDFIKNGGIRNWCGFHRGSKKWVRDKYKSLGKNVKKFFGDEKQQAIDKRFGSYFQHYNVPIFTIECKSVNKWAIDGHTNDAKFTVMLDDKLEDFEFVKLFPPYQAYQELNMYVTSALRRQTPDMAKVSDESLIKKKGFNKFSFRQDKGVKKPRRRGKK